VETPHNVRDAIAAMAGDPVAVLAARADEAVYEPLITPLLAVLARVTGPVLDVGAGTGVLSRHVRRVVAVDNACSHLRANPVARLVCADAARLPFADNSFAAAVSGFGVNLIPHPERVVAELARIAPMVAVLTWARPDTPFAPNDVITEVLSRHAASVQSRTGVLVDRLSERVGQPSVLRDMMVAAGLRATARHLSVEVPWPGVAEFVAYRLGMFSAVELAAGAADVAQEALDAVAALPESQLNWCPQLVLAVGHR
jgi:SAM-dependent methyltransferase